MTGAGRRGLAGIPSGYGHEGFDSGQQAFNVLHSRAPAWGNGETDDDHAIQYWLDLAGAMGGHVVYVPPGVYRCRNTLVIPSGVTLRGAGANSVLVAASALNGTLVSFAASTTDAALEDLVLDGNSAHQASGTLVGIGNTCANVALRGVRPRDWKTVPVTVGTGCTGLAFGRGEWLDVRECGAVADGQYATDGAITIGTNALSSATAAFAVGKVVRLLGAGAAGAAYCGRITAVVGTTATVAPVGGAAAGATVSAAQLWVGTTNTKAFQAAIDVAAALPDGAAVWVPAGRYVFGGDGTADGNQNYMLGYRTGAAIHGAGMGATYLVGAVPSSNLLYARAVSNIGCFDMTLDNIQADTADCFKAISGAAHIRVERVAAVGGFAGFQLMGCTDYSLVACYAHDQDTLSSGGYGYSLAERHGSSFDSFGTARGQLVNCRAAACPAAGFRLVGEDDTGAGLGVNYVTDLQLANCHAFQCNVGFVVVLAKACSFANCEARASTTYGWDFQLSTANTLSACRAVSNGLDGFRLFGSSYTALTGCMATENSTVAPHANAGFYALASGGGTAADHNVLVGCVGSSPATGSQSYGYFWGGGAGNNLLVGCQFEGNFQPKEVWLAATDQALFCRGLDVTSLSDNGSLVWSAGGVLFSRSDSGTGIVSGIHPLDGPVAVGAGADTGAVSLDTRARRVFRRTLVGDSTYTLANPQENGEAEIHLIQDGTGLHVVAFASTVLWAGGVAPVWSTAANARDVVRLRYDSTLTKWVEAGRSIGVA